jgi:hypothetical protein
MLDKRFSKNKDIPYRIIEEEAVLVDVEDGEVIHLNEVGAQIWEAVDGKNKVSDIINHICSEFEVSEIEARRDVLSFLKDLLKKGILVDG